ncbi:MAG: N-acetylmuramoyl-L-alanine amidase [Chitinophagales bacterium]|nr:N-acetylmuramoyl-L-alanine amidase [Chitinophagales bacterium]MDW8418802.1 N-acetylmuramoyl-L-alanine amidase [Chitinophagales bacterium]
MEILRHCVKIKKTPNVRFPYLLLISFFLWTSPCFAQGKYTIRTVVIDAGHGGKDPGAIGPGKTFEKDIALVIALKLGDYIQKNFPNINVIYTRKSDVFLELYERANIANKNKADLFISIHVNSSPNKETYGTSTYVLGLHRTEANLEVAKRENSVINLEEDRDKNYEFDPNTPEGHIIMSMKQNAFLDQSIEFASKVENQFENYARRKSLGVKQAGFYVLYKTTMPSILAEIGFISNAEEEKFLNTTKGQDLIATSLFNAFKDYKNELEGSEGAQYAFEQSLEMARKEQTNAGTTVSTTTSTTTETTSKNNSPTTKDVTTGVDNKSVIDYPQNTTGNPTASKSIRKPEEGTSGGGRYTNSNKIYGDEVQPIYVTQSTVDPFDTTSFSTIAKSGNKPTAPKTSAPAPKEVTHVETPPKTETVTVAKSEYTSPVKTSNVTSPAPTSGVNVSPSKHPSVPDHKPQSGTIFKVQLFALRGELKEYDKVARIFGARELSAEVLDNGFIRYYAGNATSAAEAQRLLQTAKSNGYPNAVIVGFQNGTRMSAEELSKFIRE